jgi:mono/diheme cytochrome c family protein
MANGNNTVVKNASFTDGVWAHGSSTDQVALVIKNGVKGTAMLPFAKKLNEAEIQALAKYVREFDPKLKASGAK